MSFGLALVVAAFSGFIALSYEILWYRVISFASWGLAASFGLLLAAYLFGIALGSRAAGWFCKDDARAGDTRMLRALALFAFAANVVAWLVVPFFGWCAKKYDWPPALGLVALAAGMLGAILPLVSHFGIAPDDRAGQRLSYVYLANIVGSAAGSLITGFVFLDKFSLQQIGAIIALSGLGLVALLVAVAELKQGQRVMALASVLGMGVVLWVLTPKTYDRIWERLLYKHKFTEDTHFKEVIETKSGVITITQDDTVYGGGAYDGRFNTSLMWDRNSVFRAYGVRAMHPAPKEVLMIGLASGSWANVVAHLDGVERLTVIEINPGYMQAIAKHDQVKSLLTNPKVSIVIDDGRRWLRRHPEKFDVIVMNTTYHWRSHGTNLLSSEFMEILRQHMKQGGLAYFNTTSSDDVQKTAATVFPYALRVLNFMAVSDSPLVWDKQRWFDVLQNTAVDGVPAIDLTTERGKQIFEEQLRYADSINAPADDESLESRDALLARTRSAKVVTDDNMVPEFRTVIRFQEPP